MRAPLAPALLAALGLAGCAPTPVDATGALLGANLLAVPIIHRDLFDLAYSAITGRDCSIVRLDRNESYCKPIAPRPPIPEYCTRSLANVDCWADPTRVANIGPSVADGPSQLTPLQEQNRTAPWPGVF